MSLASIIKSAIKGLGKILTSKAAKKIYTDSAMVAAGAIAEKGLDKLLRDKKMSLKGKLKKLDKLKNTGILTKKEYDKYRKKILDSHYDAQKSC